MTVINTIRKDLYTRFAHAIDTDVIDGVLDAALDEHNENARVKEFVPVLAARDARNELTLYAAPALHIEFASRSNRTLARAAAAIARQLSGRRVNATVAPAHPENCLDEKIEWVMDERSLSAPAGERAERRTLRTPDVVVYLGADEAEDRAARRAEFWNVPSADGMSVEQVRELLDDLTARIQSMLEENNIPTAHAPLAA
ncbi:hypothetical protein QP027_10495 [Corynebacterium breve]|uniref:Protein tyrosine phosphatase n=1 Tax=Corynebacterium breve TaxID=3049799 RepID=A0ABY8VDH4_9CORY|nr:hypothetical protein [Corynebacterium breve]WIM67514.1 hypothetical protein QP027_10495 [Corynebacterium breve]